MIESKRLIMREIDYNDFKSLELMLKDIEVMYAWEHAFSDDEINQWIGRRIKGYADNGYDYFLAIDKSTDKPIGQIGILKENINGVDYLGIGWILIKAEQGKGYATEGAKALLDYAFDKLNATQVIADIRPSNIASIKVAEKLNMQPIGEFIKHYDGKDMTHIIFSVKKENMI